MPSHDGVLVPLSLIYNKNLKKNGKNPILIDGYGAYGYAMEPYFSAVMLSWVVEGGIYAIAHGSGGSMAKVYDEWSTIFAFAFWQTGHPDYQYKEK